MQGEREREREASQERGGSPHTSPHDGNNFRHKKVQGEREKVEEGEGEEGRRRGRKGGEEIDTRERGKGLRDEIVSVI